MTSGDIVSRTFAAILGGWLATNALAAAIAVWMPTTPATALYLTGQWAFVPYLLLILWSFSTRDHVRAWGLSLALTLVGGLAVALKHFV